MKKLNLTLRNRRRKYTKKAPTKAFASKVKAVINKVAENKKYTLDGSFSNVPAQVGCTTWNLLNGIGQGTGSGDRVGDKIYLKSIRGALELINATSLGGTPISTDVTFRVVIFRGKYDYTSTSYPYGEIFEGNEGALPNNAVTAPIDLDQVTVLYDGSHVITPHPLNASTIRKQIMKFSIPVNKSFTYRSDDAFQKNSNLYLCLAQDNYALTAAACRPCMRLTFTDV